MAVANNSFLSNLSFNVGLLALMLFSSCQSNSKEDVRRNMFFSLYDSSQNVIEKEYYKMEWHAKESNLDSLVVIDKEGNSFNFLQYTDASNISLICEGEKFTIYSIEDSLIHEISNHNCKLYPPFINRYTSYIESRHYVINDHEYTIHHFVADNGLHRRTYDYYILEKVGPICIYSFDSNEYLICDSLSSFQINNAQLSALTRELTADSLFFSKFILEKYFPDFHRPVYK